MNRRGFRLACGCVGWGLIAGCFPALGEAANEPSAATNQPSVQITLATGLRITKPVRTFKELREQRAVKQRYDFSCGAAALTIFMQQYYGLDVTEETLVNYIIHKRGFEEAIRRYKEKKGFSMLDLKLVATAVGFRCVAYADMELHDLVELNEPAIIPIRLRQYDHFVVFRGLRDDRVFLTDPIVGNVTIKAGNFGPIWRDGMAMVLHSRFGDKPKNWQPEATTQGYVSQDMVRRLAAYEGLGFVPRPAGEF